MHASRRRMLSSVRSDRPITLIDIHSWQRLQQIHVGFVIGVERSDVSPLAIDRHASGGTAETIGHYLMRSDDGRKNVLSEIVRGIAIVILLKQLHEQVRRENINAHRGQRVRGITRTT